MLSEGESAIFVERIKDKGVRGGGLADDGREPALTFGEVR